DVNALQAATAALTNLAALHERNAAALVAAGGVTTLAAVLDSPRTEDLLNLDQVDEIHANAAEALANATADVHGSAVAAAIAARAAEQLHDAGLRQLVLLCGSRNLQVRRHMALVLGNVAQRDDHRAAVGRCGGVEALITLCE
ncbi:unnamed protein product, partial [Phaeothamnion confervicola]